jgi:hypothetical protein
MVGLGEASSRLNLIRMNVTGFRAATASKFAQPNLNTIRGSWG